mgnify:CR=1 FL=1
MIQALLFPVFDYVKDNTWAQVVVGLGVGYIVLKARDKLRDRQTTKRVERRIEKKSRKVQTQIRKSNNEKSTQVADARASAPSGTVAADELPDDIRSILIRD